MSRRTAIYALSIIFLANFFNYVDRQLVAALEKPLKEAFGFSTTQFALLHTYFTIGYMICSMPIGFAADRVNRVRLLSACIVVWSMATVACGLAKAGWIVAVARVFIGVGEAGCLIIGPSLITDFFSKEVRGKALSVFYLGLPLGGTAAYIMAGVLFDFGWQNMFFVAGVPGFVIAGLLLMLQDPPRGAGEGAGGHGVGKAGFREYVALLKTRTLLMIILAQTFAVIILIPLLLFGVGFFEEVRGMGEKKSRIALGVIALIAGGLGNWLSGVIGDRLSKRGVKGAYALMAGVAFLAGFPCMVVGFYAPSPWVYLPAITLGAFCYFLCMPAVNTQIANVTSPAQRATAWAMAVFILHLLGDTAAPPVFGQVEKHFDRQTAFAIFSGSMVLASACCFIAARTARADEDRVREKLASETRIKSVP
jgi:MFS family permease